MSFSGDERSVVCVMDTVLAQIVLLPAPARGSAPTIRGTNEARNHIYGGLGPFIGLLFTG